jgi:hypothetical protein
MYTPGVFLGVSRQIACETTVQVDANKKAGTGLTTFEDMYEEHYAGNTIDMLEFAMWWEGVNCRTPDGAPTADVRAHKHSV